MATSKLLCGRYENLYMRVIFVGSHGLCLDCPTQRQQWDPHLATSHVPSEDSSCVLFMGMQIRDSPRACVRSDGRAP